MQTLGQYRVGVSFNPSGSTAVDDIKTVAAGLIDLIDQTGELTDDPDLDAERVRCARIAMEHAEAAAMWAVKAITKGSRT